NPAYRTRSSRSPAGPTGQPRCQLRPSRVALTGPNDQANGGQPAPVGDSVGPGIPIRAGGLATAGTMAGARLSAAQPLSAAPATTAAGPAPHPAASPPPPAPFFIAPVSPPRLLSPIQDGPRRLPPAARGGAACPSG